MNTNETQSLPALVDTLADAFFKWGINPPTFDMKEAHDLKNSVIFYSTEEEKRLMSALRAIATFPVTDPKSKMDAYNMGKIAREALGMSEE